MENEFKEKLSDEETKSLAERILKLSDNEIDELCFKCGLVYTVRDSDYKALSSELIEEFREDKENSQMFWTLIGETPLKEIFQNLGIVEKESK
jgi:hypothetical protein